MHQGTLLRPAGSPVGGPGSLAPVFSRGSPGTEWGAEQVRATLGPGACGPVAAHQNRWAARGDGGTAGNPQDAPGQDGDGPGQADSVWGVGKGEAGTCVSGNARVPCPAGGGGSGCAARRLAACPDRPDDATDGRVCLQLVSAFMSSVCMCVWRGGGSSRKRTSPGLSAQGDVCGRFVALSPGTVPAALTPRPRSRLQGDRWPDPAAPAAGDSVALGPRVPLALLRVLAARCALAPEAE